VELEIQPCKYINMRYWAEPPYEYRTVTLSIEYTRCYMNKFFGRDTDQREIDIYVNYIVGINFRDEEMYTMFKLAHG
jgi:hypothetical protein